MAHVVKDRVMETTSSTGTGTITLGGAATGFQDFSVIGNGNTTYYTIVGGTEWEVGIGTYTASGTTLSRDTVLESSNGGSLVNFSAGTKNVFVTYPAEESVDQDTAQTLTNKTLTSPTLTSPVLGTPSSGTLTNCTGYTYANLSGTVPTWNQNTTGNAATATLATKASTLSQNGGNGTAMTFNWSGQVGQPTWLWGSNDGTNHFVWNPLNFSVNFANRAPEWQGSGSVTDWDQQFRDTEAASATQRDLNSGVNCPTGGGWWFAESYRHSNSSSFWGTQYAHGWEDRANTRYQRNVSGGGFGQWYLDDGVRAWASFSSGGIRLSKNVSSFARQGTGQYTVNFAVAMPDTNYSSVASGGNSPDGSDTIANCVYVNSSQVKCRSHNSGAGQIDVNAFSIAIFR
jgi:hypothetical protein